MKEEYKIIAESKKAVIDKFLISIIEASTPLFLKWIPIKVRKRLFGIRVDEIFPGSIDIYFRDKLMATLKIQ